MRLPVARVAHKGGERRFVLFFFVALTASAALPGTAISADTLRVCADPDNLPFSRAEGPDRGLYVELAELVAGRLGLRSEYAWFPSNYGRRAVRNTLLADRCDAYFGLPGDAEFMDRSVIRTRPFLGVGYAVIGPRPLALSSLDDIKGRRVAVQYGTTPQLLLAIRPGFRTVTFKLAEEAMEALTRAEADVAFLWGPTAGYFNKTRLGGAYAIVPIAGEGLQWQAAVGVRKGQDSLKVDLDRVLDQLKPEITTLADKYGFPLGRPVNVDGQRGMLRPPERGAGATSARAASGGRARPAPSAGVSSSTVDGLIRLGRSLFNQSELLALPRAQRHEPRTDPRLAPADAPLWFSVRETAYATITARASRQRDAGLEGPPRRGGDPRTFSNSWSPSSAEP